MPLVRARAPGISQLPQIADKVRAWAQTVQVEGAPLQRCLAAASPEDIAGQILAHPSNVGTAHPTAS